MERMIKDANAVFQSTHPVRGATRLGLLRCAGSNYFNPRTP